MPKTPPTMEDLTRPPTTAMEHMMAATCEELGRRKPEWKVRSYRALSLAYNGRVDPLRDPAIKARCQITLRMGPTERDDWVKPKLDLGADPDRAPFIRVAPPTGDEFVDVDLADPNYVDALIAAVIHITTCKPAWDTSV